MHNSPDVKARFYFTALAFFFVMLASAPKTWAQG
jgi:hypothetical protein